MGSFEDAFAVLTDKQRQASEAAAIKAVERAQDNARARAVAEPVLRAAGIAVRNKLVELGVPIPVNSNVWLVGPQKVPVCRDGFISDRYDLTGPEGLEDLLRRIRSLPLQPTQADDCAGDTTIRVDAYGALVVTYTNDGLELNQLHTYLARSVEIMGANHERERANIAVRKGREQLGAEGRAVWLAEQNPTPTRPSKPRWWRRPTS